MLIGSCPRWGSTELGRPRHVRLTPVSDRTANIAGGPVRAMSRHALALMFAVLLKPSASALVREAEHQCDSPHQNEADGPRRI